MHRSPAFLLVLLSALYGGLAAIATPAAAAEPAQAAPVQSAPVQPAVAQSTPAQPAPAPAPTQPATAEAKQPHVALLLPLNSTAFAPAAEAVRQGVMAAVKTQTSPLPVRTYATTDGNEDILAAYRTAQQAGAQVVIGPLTRSGVTALAHSGLPAVPTLALNAADGDQALPPGFYLFSLSAEAEARQVARSAFNEGRRSAATVSSGTPLAKRTQAAFVDEWQKLGGKLALQAVVSADTARLAALHEGIVKHPADMIFLAADPEKARLARPYLRISIPTYATSLVYDGQGSTPANIDLIGIRFVEMPWLLVPDHPAVMIYPRPNPALAVDLERLYALGIDALRLATILIKEPKPKDGMTLDGVTGQITLAAQHFQRELAETQFRPADTATASTPPADPEVKPEAQPIKVEARPETKSGAKP